MKRLPPGFGRLWTASTVSTVGDGISFTAGPLLAATITRDPLQIGLVGAASFLPWLLVGLVSGAVADRSDRRRLMWTVDLGRGLVLALLAAAILAGWASIPLLAAGAFLLGVGQTLFDSAAQAAIPTIVGRDPEQLATANGRLLGAQTVGQQFVGPPVGGALFSVAAWLPYAADAVSFVGSSALVASIRGTFTIDRDGPRTSLRADIAEGLRWLVRHRLLRSLAVLIAMINLVFMGTETVLVLVAQDRLGLGEIGFGVLLTAVALGSVVGSLVAARVARLVGEGRAYVISVVLLALVIATPAWTTSPWVAGAALAVVGFSVTIGNVILQTLRQAVTPAGLLGRVVSAFRLIGMGTIPVGALLGGVLGRIDLRVPYVAGAVVFGLCAVGAAVLLRGDAIGRARAEADALSVPANIG